MLAIDVLTISLTVETTYFLLMKTMQLVYLVLIMMMVTVMMVR
jgi:hypothetical protein